MIIGILKETASGETRVALTPSVIPLMIKEGHEILVQSGAGLAASFTDAQYIKAGAKVAKNASAVFSKAQIVVKVRPPRREGKKHEAELLRDGSIFIGFMAPAQNPDLLKIFGRKNILSFAMEYIPRITRAQSMDALSSMATVAGYKAVLLATEHSGKMFPLLMTAAGTVSQAQVLILGVGVAGLQAIATAKRLGAKVEAFDPRPAVVDQVKSLGATFVEMEVVADAETKGGYAKEMSAEFLKKEQEAIATRLPKTDVVVCTAQVFGKKAPVLITKEMIKHMRPGAVIVDLAAETGGNCEVSKVGEVVHYEGVTVIGPTNVASLLPVDASQMYARNIANLVSAMFPQKATTPNFEDQVVRESCITKEGKVVHPSLATAKKEAVKKAPTKKGRKK
jgi:H+-translocating NAD(P) transhydrogenase subunit alpha